MEYTPTNESSLRTFLRTAGEAKLALRTTPVNSDDDPNPYPGPPEDHVLSLSHSLDHLGKVRQGLST